MELLYPANRKVLAFTRHYDDETILVVANLSRHAQHCSISLSTLAGRVPVELFGRNEFPPLSDGDYPLALGPYGFYWFSLETPKPQVVQVSRPADMSPTTIMVRRGPEDILRKTYRPRLETALHRYVRRSRWFNGKARRTRTSTIEDIIPVEVGRATSHLVVLRIDYTEGEPQSYLIPVYIAKEEQAILVLPLSQTPLSSHH